nr:hypothetical protein [Tanacetum cinerariifolium]
FSPIDIPEEKAVTFSNLLFNSNDDFIFSHDDSLSDEDVPEDNVKIYSYPLFEFNDEYISSDVNPLFDEVLENIKSSDSDDSNLDEPDLLVTPFSDANKDECFDSGGDDDEINVLDFHHDLSIPAMSVASILEGFIDEPPLEENDDLFDLEPKNDDWKKILYDAPIDDLMTKDKNFDLGIHDQIFSPTYRIEEEQVANARYWKILACCDDDDDDDSAVTPSEPVDSLSMGDEHLDTIPATESNEFIKSSVENLVPNLSEAQGKNGCDLPACFT